jgi:hypothetical protein
MSRRSTARKTTSVEESAIDGDEFALAYTIYRAELERAKATKWVLRLLFGYTILWLPIHYGVCWLAVISIGLATAATLLLAGGLVTVGVAKWLGLDDVLQKLPVLLAIGLVVLGVAWISNVSTMRPVGGGFGTLETLLLVSVVVTVFGSLFLPAAAAYQTVTLKTSFLDLFVVAGALLASLGVIVLGREVSPPVLKLIAGTACGGFSALVVLEYAGWARANPQVGLHEAAAFSEFNVKEEIESTVLAGALFGLGSVLLGAHVYATSCSSSDHSQYVLFAHPNEPYPLRGSRGVIPLGGLFLFAGGILLVTGSLDSFRSVNPLRVFRIAWDAILVFFTYPEVSHPLAHRFCVPWLRPASVRVALAGLLLVTIATAAISPAAPPTTPENGSAEEKPSAAAFPYVSPPTVSSSVHEGDIDLAMAEGRNANQSETDRRTVRPTAASQTPVSVPHLPTTDARSSEARATEFVIAAVAIALGAPLCVYAMVCLLGVAVLPAHFSYFETPVQPRE